MGLEDNDRTMAVPVAVLDAHADAIRRMWRLRLWPGAVRGAGVRRRLCRGAVRKPHGTWK